jgi:hypothetical protein
MADHQKLRRDLESKSPVTSSIKSSLERAAPQSRPLDPSLRGALEPRFGHSFANVRVHADGEADQLASQVGARAFANGSDLFFRSDAYSPETARGQRLLAHELTHVVQQERFGTPAGLRLSQSSDASEVEANATADAVLAGETATVQSAAAAAIARDGKDDDPDLSGFGDPLNENSPLKNTPFRINPFPQQAPDPFNDPRADSQKDWDKWQAERRGDKYPSPLTDPKSTDPKDPHNNPLYWKDWSKKGAPEKPIPDPTAPPWFTPAPRDPQQPGDYPTPDEDQRYA